MPKGNARRVGIVQFANGIEILKSDLDRAIGGGMKRAGLSRASQQQREDVISTVYLMLVTFFAKGKTPTGTVGSLAFKIAYLAAVDTYRRPDAYEKRRSYGIDVAEAKPTADSLAEAPNAEQAVLDHERIIQNNRKLLAAVKALSETDRNVIIDAFDRKVALQRTTKDKIKLANLVSQREKRAKDRLVKAYRACDQAR
jgi:hypothetical protein